MQFHPCSVRVRRWPHESSALKKGARSVLINRAVILVNNDEVLLFLQKAATMGKKESGSDR
jgi:hypothetical protein